MTSSKQVAYKEISASLMAEINQGLFPPGSMLPSESTLCKRFSVSRSTAREALKHLGRQGVVTAVHGRGWQVEGQVSRRPIQGGRTVSVVRSCKDQTVLMLMDGLRMVLEPEGYILQYELSQCSPEDAPYAQFLQDIFSRKPAGIVLCEDRLALSNHFPLLAQSGIPVVTTYCDSPFDSILPDVPLASRELVSRLINQGHGHIIFLSDIDAAFHSTGFRERLQYFESATLSAKIESSVLRLSANDLFTPEMLQAQLGAGLSQISHKRTALVLQNVYMLPPALMALTRLGLAVPRDLTLCGYFGAMEDILLWTNYSANSLISLCENSFAIGQAAATRLFHRMKGLELTPAKTTIPFLFYQ